MSRKRIEVSTKDGKVHEYTEFRNEPHFVVLSTDDGDFLLILDDSDIEGGFRMADVESFTIFNY